MTNEDPYDEDPKKIIEDVEKGVLFSHSSSKMDYEIIIDRREAISSALKIAKPGDTIIITGKGAEPWLMGPNGSRQEWDDREVVREELKKIGG